MEVDLAGFASGHPERFVPELMGGELIAAQHLGRYWWAAQLVEGRRVLDAGCGVAYGSAILAEAGAREVVGVDLAADVLDAVRAQVPPNVELVEGDVTELPFENGSFDLAVCFEVIEHVEEPALVLDELRRVLTDDGLVVVSTPNRSVFPPGNPHHHRELLPDELEGMLAERFSSVRLVRQHDWSASAILATEDAAAEAGEPVADVEVRKLVPLGAGDELFTVALAGTGALPPTRGVAVLGDASRHEELVARLEEALAAQTEHASRLEEANSKQSEHISRLEEATEALRQAAESKHAAFVLLESELRARAFELEQRDVALTSLNERLFELEQGTEWRAASRAAAEEELAALRATKLFRYSTPLRRVYGIGRRLAGRGG